MASELAQFGQEPPLSDSLSLQSFDIPDGFPAPCLHEHHFSKESLALIMTNPVSGRKDSSQDISVCPIWRYWAWAIWIFVFPTSWFAFAQMGDNVAEPWLPYSVFLQALTFTMCVYLVARSRIGAATVAGSHVAAIITSCCAFGCFSFMSWLLRIWTG